MKSQRHLNNEQPHKFISIILILQKLTSCPEKVKLNVIPRWNLKGHSNSMSAPQLATQLCILSPVTDFSENIALKTFKKLRFEIEFFSPSLPSFSQNTPTCRLGKSWICIWPKVSFWVGRWQEANQFTYWLLQVSVAKEEVSDPCYYMVQLSTGLRV